MSLEKLKMIDVRQRLLETTTTIALMRSRGIAIPEEALEMEEIFQRCVDAEALIETNLESQLSLGKEAYEAYCNATNWKSLVSGADLPPWDNLSEPIRSAWMVSAAWVAGRVLRKFGVTK